MDVSNPAAEQANVDGRVACAMTNLILAHVRATLGHQAVEDVVRRADVSHAAEYLSDVSHWIAYADAVALFEAAAEATGDPCIGVRVGESAVRRHAGTNVATLLRSLGSPEAILQQIALTATKFTTVTDMRAIDVGPGRAIVEASPRSADPPSRFLCDYRRGLLSQPPALFGLPPAHVEETQCSVRGDGCCVYHLTWDADQAANRADPAQLIIALEAQLAAMAERLDDIYAAARDLIAVDDLDTALARITQRAATAVRAPKYLLAVETGDGRLRAHHYGFEDDDADQAAAALLADEHPGEDPCALVAEVASRTRRYGRLTAISPVGFFPHEREILEVYASYAATALDTATALEESRRQHARSRALLGLAERVATATSSQAVAEQLIEATPAVIDCDRVMVFLWNEDRGELRCAARTGRDLDSRIRDLVVRAADTPHLAEMLRRPEAQPRFFDRSVVDPFLASLVSGRDVRAVTLIPIFAHGRFYGVLVASVVDRPERLAPSEDLRDRLAGVAAQAATALDNAELIERISHRARHDSLTGLLGHGAFHEALGAQLETRQPFALATLDIDDFKRINDAFGHPVGDEALRLVGAALRRSVRSTDSVFRVGGEEFALLLPGHVTSTAAPLCERVRQAVAETEFCAPLRVSIGVASWPQDATQAEELVRLADDALYAAKHAGKDRTMLVPG